MLLFSVGGWVSIEKLRVALAVLPALSVEVTIKVCAPFALTELLQAVATASRVQVTPARPEPESEPVPLKVTAETYQPFEPTEPLRLPLAEGGVLSKYQTLESVSVAPEV